jgi:hypothetical protein
MIKIVPKKQDVFDLFWVVLALAFSVIFSIQTRDMRNTWPGIAPPPSNEAALLYGYGDKQLSYRNVGLILQNAGDTGGRTTNFKDYDYNIIEQWLWLSNTLDPNANYVPSLAAYYFSAAKEPEKVERLIDYLATVGDDTTGERWRWLGHAVYLARFTVKDQVRALELANKLAALDAPNMPSWTKVMPAYVQTAMGNKKEARELLLLMIADPNGNYQQADINQSCWYINEHLREKNDGLDQNQIFHDFCSVYLESERKLKHIK